MKRIAFFGVLALAGSCTSLENAEPTPRTTFVQFYEKPVNFYGKAVELDGAGGYVLGAESNDGIKTTAYISLVDSRGNVTKELSPLDSTSISSIKAVSDGYLVFGTRIKVNAKAEQTSDLKKERLQIFKIGKDGAMVVQPKVFGKPDSQNDFTASALTIDPSGQIIGLGTIAPTGGKSSAIVMAFNPTTLDTTWVQVYSTDANSDRSYNNSRSVHATGNAIIWASSLKSDEKSYLMVPYVVPNSNNDNAGIFGRNDDKFISGEDIASGGGGYGVIGTYSDTQVLPNIFFMRTDPSGSLIEGSERYYDGVESANNKVLDESSKNTSGSSDYGTAIAGTSDGGFILAGTFTQTADRGAGGTDIWLIRIDPFGNPLWNKLIGGSGDESVSSIRELSDGSFVICGSSDKNQLSSAYIIKTDKNGELK